MYEVNPKEWKTDPFPHQLDGVKRLLKPPFTKALADDPGLGKSKQFIDLACILYASREIDTVIVCCPALVKTVWSGAEFGQIHNHVWTPSWVDEYDARNTQIRPLVAPYGLHWVITNYEFLRNETRLTHLMSQLHGRKIMIVFDESSYIKSYRSAQTKAAKKLRMVATRAYIADGTLVSESLVDLYSPFDVLDKNIIGCGNWWMFRGRYCVLGGYQSKQITGYRNVEQLQQRLAPFIIRRTKDELDLPPKLHSVVEVPLTESTWKIYREVRDEMVTWLDHQTPSITMHAIVKLTRLSQLTSGIIGGLQRSQELAKTLGLDYNSLFDEVEQKEDVLETIIDNSDVRVVSTEKADWVNRWFLERVAEQPNFRTVLWMKFRKQQEIMKNQLRDFNVLQILGGQKKSLREETVARFNREDPNPIILLGQQQAGGIGLNLQAQCSWAVYLNNEYSLRVRKQSEDRIHRMGQRASTVNYIDVCATGPKGQKTIDHAVLRTLMRKDEFAFKTTSYWVNALLDE